MIIVPISYCKWQELHVAVYIYVHMDYTFSSLLVFITTLNLPHGWQQQRRGGWRGGGLRRSNGKCWTKSRKKRRRMGRLIKKKGKSRSRRSRESRWEMARMYERYRGIASSECMVGGSWKEKEEKREWGEGSASDDHRSHKTTEEKSTGMGSEERKFHVLSLWMDGSFEALEPTAEQHSAAALHLIIQPQSHLTGTGYYCFTWGLKIQ